MWRTLLDALVFAAALLFVVVILDQLGVMRLDGGWHGEGGYAVIDGDSLRRGETEIRLLGIDAPEYRQTCRNDQGTDYPCGREAAKALRALVSVAGMTCTSAEADRYGRALATCKAGGTDINREMVRQGWAVVYAPHAIALQYRTDELAAKREKRGLWQGRFEQPADYRARTRVSEGSVVGDGPED